MIYFSKVSLCTAFTTINKVFILCCPAVLMIFIGYFELFHDQKATDKNYITVVCHTPELNSSWSFIKNAKYLGKLSEIIVTGVQHSMYKNFAAVSAINNQNCNPLLWSDICGKQNWVINIWILQMHGVWVKLLRRIIRLNLWQLVVKLFLNDRVYHCNY